MIPRPPRSPLFPYTTLFRSEDVARSIDPQTRVTADADIAKLFVLGVGMRTHTGVARRMFGALAQRGINISMINTSEVRDRKSTRLNSSHTVISYAVFCLKKK